MELKSLHLEIPSKKPFDRSDWFEAFVGNFVIKTVETGLVDSYWFSRYEDPKRHARFRLKTAKFSNLKPEIDKLVSDLGLIDIGDEANYDGGEFRSIRFLGDNKRQVDPFNRQELLWDFLYAASRLYVDTFSHFDSEGYWYREINHDRNNNIDGETMESPHHLFCNLFAVQPRVEVLAGIANQEGLQIQLLAGHYRRWMGIPNQLVRASQRVNF